MTPDLFGRSVKVQIDTIVLHPKMHVSFKATKTLKPEPNTCELKIWNLTGDQRAALTKKKLPVVSLAAGYGTDLTQLYLGEVLSVQHERKGADLITTASTTDGGDASQKKRVHVSFDRGASPVSVLKAIVKALGIKPGNMASAVAALNKGLSATMYAEGVAINGSATRNLDTLCRSAGLEWSIQDGQLQFLDINKALAKFAIRLTPTTGLIGTPSLDAKGIVRGQSLIIKDMLPGRQVQLDGAFVKARARLLKCEYSGDTRGDAWFVDFEADTKGAR